jgi:hypothetical protein
MFPHHDNQIKKAVLDIIYAGDCYQNSNCIHRETDAELQALSQQELIALLVEERSTAR